MTETFREQEDKLFVEEGAVLEHDRWVRWQKWCHQVIREKITMNTVLEGILSRWDRQIATPYSELSEQEKESDRKETRNYLPLIHASHLRLIDYLLEKIEKMELEGESKDISNDIWYRDGFNSALSATRKILEDHKREL